MTSAGRPALPRPPRLRPASITSRSSRSEYASWAGPVVARTAVGGDTLIGGEVAESTYEEFIEEGAYVVLAIAPGTPPRMLWAVDVIATDEVPAPAESCAAYLDTLGDEGFFEAVDIQGRPIEGELELAQ